MFTTLLKYEFRRTKNILLPLNLGGLAIGAIGYFLMLIIMKLTENPESDQIIIAPLLVLLWAGLLLILALLGTTLSIILCIQFYREKFTDQGYLTFTLPASTHQILLSSYLNFLIWTIVNTIVTFVSLALMFTPIISRFIKDASQTGMEFSYFWAVMKEDYAMLFPSGTLYKVSHIMLAVSSLFYGITLPYLAITLASVLVKKMKLLVAFGIGCGMALVIGMIPSVLSVLESLIISTELINLETSVYTLGTVSQIITSVLYMGFAIGGYFLMHHLVSKKLNL